MTNPLDALPAPGSRRLAVRVTKDALRQVRGGHPWIYDGSITSTSHDGEPGDLAVVFDDNRDFAAIGLWDPGSPIRLKVLHVGKATPIGAEFFRSRIQTAIKQRAPLVADPGTDGFRLIHGENDGLPGLVIDRYGGVLVVKLYSAAWFAHLRSVLAALGDDPVILRLARNVAAGQTHGLSDGTALRGRPPAEPVLFRENGLRFECAPSKGQKTGHFLDQRDNRARVRDLAEDTRVLDLFSCTGGFSVHAAAGGARSVHSVDLSGHAVAAVGRNLAANGLVVEHRATAGDAFAAMTDLGERGATFDVVIIDPPSFAQRRDKVAAALNAYRHLTRLGIGLVEPGGLLVQASCSSRVSGEAFFSGVLSAADELGVRLEEIERTGHPIDHPVGFPEGAYLKALFARVDR